MCWIGKCSIPEEDCEKYNKLYQSYRDCLSWKMMQEQDNLLMVNLKSYDDTENRGKKSYEKK